MICISIFSYIFKNLTEVSPISGVATQADIEKNFEIKISDQWTTHLYCISACLNTE